MRHILFTLLFTFLFTQVVRSADSSTFWYGNRNNIEQLPTKSVGTDKIKAMDSVRGLSLAASDGTTMGFLDTTNLRVGFGTTSPLDFLSIKPGNNAGLTLYDSDDDNKLEISLDGIFNPQLALYDNDDNARVVLRGVGNSYITTGFFGLGASVPIAKLQINDENDNLTAGDPGNILIYTTDALAGDVGGSLNFGGRFNAGGAFTEWAGLAGRKSNATDGNVDGYLSFYTRKTGNFQQERMRIDEDGNVGIGTSDPDRPVHVEVTATNTAAKFGAASAGDAFGITPLAAGNGTIIGSFNDAESDFEPLQVRGESIQLAIRSGAGQVHNGLNINSSGNAVLATDASVSPGARFEVRSIDNATADSVFYHATNSVNGHAIRLRKARGGHSGRQAVQDGDILGQIVFDGQFDSGNNVSSSASIAVKAEEDFVLNEFGSKMQFYVTPIDTNSQQLSMELQNNGRLDLYGHNSDTVLRLFGTLNGSAREDAYINFGMKNSSALDRPALIHGQMASNDNGSVLRFYTAGVGDSSGTERMVIDNDGKVGIGTSLPSHKLNVVGDIQVEDYIRNSLGESMIGFLEGTSDDHGLTIGSSGESAGNKYDRILFSLNNAERMRIDSSGKVGIGTSSPAVKFDLVTGNTTNTALHIGEVANEGAYFASTSDNELQIWAGAELDSGAIRARATKASGITLNNGLTVFYNNSSLTDGNTYTQTERMRIDSSGNVGIGTSSIYAAGNRNLEISGGGGNASGALVLTNEAPVGSSSLGVISFNNAGDNLAQILAVRDTTNSDAGRLRFMTQATGGSVTDRLVIEANGNVGIGTVPPAAKLHVQGTTILGDDAWPTTSLGLIGNRGGVVDSGEAIWLVHNSDTTLAAGNAGELQVTARSSVASATHAGGKIRGGTANATDGNEDGFLAIDVTGDGLGFQEKMRIEADGGVVIGGTSTTYGLEAANGAVAGAGAYVDTSDERVKKNKQALSSACSIITSLEAYYFDWKSAEETADITGVTGGRDFASINNIPEGYQDVGFMAQEVESIFPQAVTSNAYGLKGLQYSKIIPVMVQCLKDKEAELTAINLNFEARLQALEAAQ